MKTTSILNLKGGVGKTITAVNLAYNLATTHNQRTLLIDTDKQASTTKFFDLHNPATAGITEILINEQPVASQILKTQYANLHLISSNMNTMNASRIINQDLLNPREYRLKNALKSIQENYDYCIIDNPPDLEMST
ncbi:MAG: AAA family ATPase, partial [Firmicutes bacterium]|nr:AAA family ATPase [Bacillota bacterium]